MNSVEKFKKQAFNTYSGIRRSLWGDLSPRCAIIIRNPRANLAVNQAAMSFWTAVAKRNTAFSFLYNNDGSASGSLPSSQRHPPQQWATPSGPSRLDEAAQAGGPRGLATTAPCLAASRSLSELAQNVQQFGVARLEDVLPDRHHKLVRDEFDYCREASPIRFGDGVRCHSRIPRAAFRDLFNEITLTLTKELFGIGFHPPKDRFAFVQRIERDGPDRNDTNTILHIDRFVPSIKIFYYPHSITSSRMSPFGFIPESHLINETYLENVREAFRTRAYKSKPFVISNPTSNSEIPLFVDGNSLVVAYTNGLHRRIPFGDDVPLGSYREAACFMFYNLYTRTTLLRKALL
jgi:hypothetical protein